MTGTAFAILAMFLLKFSIQIFFRSFWHQRIYATTLGSRDIATLRFCDAVVVGVVEEVGVVVGLGDSKSWMYLVNVLKWLCLKLQNIFVLKFQYLFVSYKKMYLSQIATIYLFWHCWFRLGVSQVIRTHTCTIHWILPTKTVNKGFFRF